MLELQGVSKQYPDGQVALDSIDLSLGEGEMAFLTGHSGAGKSTLLKLIALIERPSQGRIIVNGTDIGRLPRGHIPYYRQNIGLIFQNVQLLHDRSVFDNVALPLLIQGFSPRDLGNRVRAALDTVGLLGMEGKAPVQLSGGEQQRVGIARALVVRPRLILADEPTGNLDPELSEDIMGLFGRFNELGVSLMIATHDIDLITRLNKRRIVLSRGLLEASA
ncbi:cell division ATP-binding protein FtsE [Oceanococcus atlanticus]|uniref:Cell division ATP-binding protein FtsE n=1 Tax=Oceanococcus atlanticus TaxID=1317117 RepID=A0A1Y1SEW6_9GAMM|nr:ATP-binding cassette domain-containing protein [Oceanococcus atlanticus]ORE87540.1 cell division ATP-binding protein FtsE [Oceanococcus atlanticus]